MTLAPPGRERVDLWWVDLDGSGAIADASALSDDERRRAAALRHEVDRRRFVARRAALRDLIAGYLGTDAAAATIATTAAGKPFVVGANALDFNCSSSGSVAALVFASGARVGVDVEQRVGSQWEAFPLARFLSPAELDRLAAEPPARRDRLAATMWVLKEAVGKATGLGFSASPTGIGLRGDIAAPAVELTRDFTDFADTDWRARLVADEPFRVAAVALDREWTGARSLRWPEDLRAV
jgi:4'-phosphopantetheinyl transferase